MEFKCSECEFTVSSDDENEVLQRGKMHTSTYHTDTSRVRMSQDEEAELHEIRRELNQVAWPSDVEKLINQIKVYKEHGVKSASAHAAPPIITAVAFSYQTPSSVKITWTTDEPSDSVVRYGTTKGLGSVVSDPSRVTSHIMTLSGLSAGTTYYYTVASRDLAGNTAIDSNNDTYYEFMTRTY